MTPDIKELVSLLTEEKKLLFQEKLQLIRTISTDRARHHRPETGEMSALIQIAPLKPATFQSGKGAEFYLWPMEINSTLYRQQRISVTRG